MLERQAINGQYSIVNINSEGNISWKLKDSMFCLKIKQIPSSNCTPLLITSKSRYLCHGEILAPFFFYQNIHLVSKWLSTLEKKLEEHSKNSHPELRVFISAEPAPSLESHVIPQGILENSIKITNEPPTGMHANLHKALDNFTQVCNLGVGGEVEEFPFSYKELIKLNKESILQVGSILQVRRWMLFGLLIILLMEKKVFSLLLSSSIIKKESSF